MHIKTKLYQNLKNYDLQQIAKHYQDFTKLEACEKFAVLESLFLQRNYKEFQRTLEKHQSELRKLGILDFFQLNLSSETTEQFGSNLATSMIALSNKKQETFIYASSLFYLGLRSLQYGDTNLSLPFLEKSTQEFEKLKLDCHIFRSEYTTSLAFLLQNDFHKFESISAELLERYPKLPTIFQIYYSRFIFSMLMLRNHRKKAKDFLLRLIPLANKKELKSLKENLQKYLIYYKAIHTHKIDISEYIESPEYFIMEKLKIASEKNFKSIYELKNFIQSWSHKSNILDERLIIHTLLQNLFKQKQYELLEHSYNFFEKGLLKKKVVLFEFDLRIYKILALNALGDKQYQKQRQEFQKTAYTQFLHQLIKMEKQIKPIKKVSATLNLKENTIEMAHTIIPLERSKHFTQILMELAKSKHGIQLSTLAQILYTPGINQRSAINRIDNLVNRLRSILGHNFIIRSNKQLRIGDNYSLSIRSRVKVEKQQREQLLENFLRKSKKAFTIQDILEKVPYSRRVIQKDLQSLVENGKITKVGSRGRAVKYHWSHS